MIESPRPRLFVLDIGGEGRHALAWNLNPAIRKTIGPNRGQRIPRHIMGRGDRIPLADQCVDLVLVERMPLGAQTLSEIRRVAKPRATIILRHARSPVSDPHRAAVQLLGSVVRRRSARIGRHVLQETMLRTDV